MEKLQKSKIVQSLLLDVEYALRKLVKNITIICITDYLDVLLTVHLSIILAINQLNSKNLLL